MTLPWFRFYHEFVGDPVIQQLDFGDQRHYVMVLCLKAAGVLDREFPTEDYRHRVICRALGLDPLAGSEAKRRLQDVGLLDGSWHPPAWDKRQFKSDNSTARVQAYREKRNAQSSEEESKKETDTDTEGNVTCNVSETLPTRNATQKGRKAALPDDFGLTEARTKYATDRLPKVDCAELLEAFRDYHAKEGTVAKDWDASWRTWVRNALQFGYPMVAAPGTAKAKQIRFDANGRQISD